MNRVFNVQSFTEPMVSYTVTKDVNGEWECSCPCFEYRRRCKHVDKVFKHLKLKPKVAVV